MKYSSAILISVILISTITYTSGRGKTYDDLEEILKQEAEGKLRERTTHVAYREPLDQGSKIDPNKVIHTPKPEIQEEKAITSGYVISKAHTSGTRKSSNQTKTYEQHASKKDSYDSSDLLPLRYLKIPKRDRDAQFYFFLSTLLLLATTITIVSSCGCLFYFMLKNLIGMQQRMIHGDEGEDYDNQGGDMISNAVQVAGNQGRRDQFQRFDDEEQEVDQQQQQVNREDQLRRLNRREAQNSSENSNKD